MTSPEQIRQAQQEPQAPAEQREEHKPGHEGHTGGHVVHLHTAHPHIPIPYVTPGDMFSDMRTATSAAASMVPSPRKLVLYGLLGGMAAAGAMAWPVAVAVGAATEVITREQAARQREEHERIERTRAVREQGGPPTGERTQAPRTEQGALT
ncbi:hypothetical protein [Streptomyces sp. A012304]|uniref:hypothetical protein n=1 Tax=Streptomyces sp. A012304 TaxID=375446 RepID=UPI002232BBCC|nr:hypothetical protein [Streptomyces sp. A012304]GKQ34482.1 hypothetical protein ALMP_10310 [Streptomyces sp. A012304]